MSYELVLWVLIYTLYACGFGMFYALAPCWLPITLGGRTWKRFSASLAWPVFGAFMLGMCVATDFA